MDGKQKSVAAITQELQNCSEEALIALCSNLRTDPRKSVQLLAEKAMKRLEKEKKELERVQGMIDFEREIAGSTIYLSLIHISLVLPQSNHHIYSVRWLLSHPVAVCQTLHSSLLVFFHPCVPRYRAIRNVIIQLPYF